MLNQHNAAINLAVKDLPTARRFYEDALGFTPERTAEPSLVAYQTGATRILVYVSENAGTNKATACTWTVGEEINTLIAGLKSKGITFEHYPIPQARMEGDLHVFGTHKIAWFKDPDGNILSLINK